MKKQIAIDSHIAMGVEGFFTMRAIKNGRVVRERKFKNLITDLGMDYLATMTGQGDSTVMRRCIVGTGTATPAFSDTSLASFTGPVNNLAPSITIGVNSGTPKYQWARYVWLSAVGAVVGNLTEIGVGRVITNGELFSRALILDGGGSPTSFPVASDEQLQVTYEFRVHPMVGDDTRTVNLSATPYSVTTRALDINTSRWQADGLLAFSTYYNNTLSGWYTGALAADTAVNPAGTVVSNNNYSVNVPTYVAGSHYLDSHVTWGSGQVVGTLRTLRMALAVTTLQIQYGAGFAKATNQQLVIKQRVSWARI